MDDPAVQHLALTSGIHRLDARLHVPVGPLRGSLVVAHPHPLHGGNMDHPVVVCTAGRAAACGLLALRFDFRGVQASEGEQGDFAGHLEDWRRAAEEVAARAGDGVHLGGGFSYGSRTLATVLDPDLERRPHLDGLLLLAPATRVPTTRRDFGNLLLGRPLGEAARDARVIGHLGALALPTVVLVGDHDVVAPADELRAALPPAARLRVLSGLNHFFSRHTGAGALAVDAFVPAVDLALAELIDAARSAQG